jgi:hypothetical protein
MPNVEVLLHVLPESESVSLTDAEVHYDPATGIVEIPDLVAGKYAIRISDTQDDGKYREAIHIVRVDDTDVDGVALDFSAKMPEFPPIRGRIVGAGGSKIPSMEELYIDLIPELGPGPAVAVQSDGRFHVPVGRDAEDSDTVVVGEAYRVLMENLPEGWYIQEAKLGGADALGALARVRGGAELEITLSPRAASIKGVVKGIDGKPAASVQAVLIPDRAKERPDLYASTYTDDDGRFSFAHVPPGEYTIYAWAKDALAEENAFYDPAIVKRLAGNGVAVRAAESSRVNVTVTLAPAPESSAIRVRP